MHCHKADKHFLIICQLHNYITLLIQPVRKFFRAGCSCFYSLFSLQCFFLEVSKGSLYFFQTVSWKAVGILCPVDFVAPVLALVFVEQVVAVFPCPLVKLPLVLQRLLLPALIAAQLIPLALSKEDAPADLALLEAQPPVVEPVQVIGNQRIKGSIAL